MCTRVVRGVLLSSFGVLWAPLFAEFGIEPNYESAIAVG